MKVPYLIDTPEVGGTETSLAEIISRLDDVTSVVCSLYPGDAMRERFERAGARVISLDLPGRYAFRAAAKRVRRIVRDERPELIHCSLFRAGMVARWVAPRAGVPLIDTFVNHSFAADRWAAASPMARLKLAGVRTLDRWSSSAVTLFTANCPAIRDARCGAASGRRGRISGSARVHGAAAREGLRRGGSSVSQARAVSEHRVLLAGLAR